ncbi:site-specific DNA-methyltransferase [Brachymonas sp.]|uniref:site-specific DNA-methyltransferase n=1 Tax=Brachymonas sp. TaxID=1936292 RepID=UPI0035AE4F05
MDKLKMHSPNLTQDNIARIRDLFPGCVTEAKGEDGNVKLAVDFDQLRQELADSVLEGTQERYQLNWPGKRESILAANSPIQKTLRPSRNESLHFDETKNIFIEGDNLEALKLLQDNYLGRIKTIYIDPPYNTGSDLIYNDYFTEGASDFRQKASERDELENRLVTNSDTQGRYHSNWLSMIYPRLKIARSLLSDDGLIFISIGDEEQANLKKLCDEIFGGSNFIATFPRITKKGGKSTDAVSKNHDYIICYSKSDAARLYPFEHSDEGFSNSDQHVDERGKYKLNQTLDYDTLGYVKSLDYEIEVDGVFYYAGGVTKKEWEQRRAENPKDGYRWRWSKDLFNFGLANDFVVIKNGRNGARIYTKTYERATIDDGPSGGYSVVIEDRTKALPSIEFIENEYSNDNAKKEVQKLIGKGMFDYPKPSSLVQKLVSFSSRNDDIVLDFFAGSCTTAHAVMKANAEDGGNRRFIVIQIPEACSEKSQALKLGFKSISAIGIERIKQSGATVLAGPCHSEWKKDIGFRVLKVDTSNMADVYYVPDALNKAEVDLFVDNIKPNRTEEDLLFQVMLDWGVDLALPIARESIQDKEVFFVDDNALAACFNAHSGIDEAFVKELAKRQPLRVVFRDAGFKDDATKINVEQIFKLLSPATEVKCI